MEQEEVKEAIVRLMDALVARAKAKAALKESKKENENEDKEHGITKTYER